MAEAQPEEETVTRTVTESGQSTNPSVVLRLHKPKDERKVQWTNDTVDNENMNKKKSKCCCIYEKPKPFGYDDDDEDDDDGCSAHCRGHKNKCFGSNENNEGAGVCPDHGPAANK